MERQEEAVNFHETIEAYPQARVKRKNFLVGPEVPDGEISCVRSVADNSIDCSTASNIFQDLPEAKRACRWMPHALGLVNSSKLSEQRTCKQTTPSQTPPAQLACGTIPQGLVEAPCTVQVSSQGFASVYFNEIGAPKSQTPSGTPFGLTDKGIIWKGDDKAAHGAIRKGREDQARECGGSHKICPDYAHEEIFPHELFPASDAQGWPQTPPPSDSSLPSCLSDPVNDLEFTFFYERRTDRQQGVRLGEFNTQEPVEIPDFAAAVRVWEAGTHVEIEAGEHRGLAGVVRGNVCGSRRVWWVDVGFGRGSEVQALDSWMWRVCGGR